MAHLNGMYIFVSDEETSYGVEVTEHTVEEGIEISDHVKKKAISISLSGEIVGKNAKNTLSKIRTAHQNGTVCKYAGRVTLSNCLITDLSISTSNKIWGGYEFSMTLKQVRTAKTSYKVYYSTKKKTTTQQKTKKSTTTYVYHTVKKGDCVWNLVAASNAPYKNLKRPAINGKSYSACDWVMQMNQSAFSRRGDFRTLQIGKKLNVGAR